MGRPCQRTKRHRMDHTAVMTALRGITTGKFAGEHHHVAGWCRRERKPMQKLILILSFAWSLSPPLVLGFVDAREIVRPVE